ncbi:Molybdopterin-guanine dinucleotide biosynthesis protein MobA [Desulfovibrio sp. DV]|uniref:molybdenum cofactor guanylyltransferase n=1 Tax=Desulfovibrio sp. DV TaxID=1844708 RepID=UPI00094B901D|nr:molybdenum cofactor guanylyltransferase [Desulfovibrio sp. DV]OLN26563.1 Molybdopterin-guanine dinucleotide biosynthesis protein MobA [Desulfovibrio sp. DV]
MTQAGPTPLGVILAGGKSSRMGRDKAWLTFFGQPLFRRVADTLAAVTGEVLVSGRDPLPFGLAVPWVADETPELGPAGGVLSVLAATGRPCLVVSCDLPFLDEATLVRLIAAWSARPPTTLMTTYRIVETGFVESLVAIYDPAGVEVLRRCLLMGQRRLSAIFPEALRCHVDYSREDPAAVRAFFNVNSPPDLIRARGMEEGI